MTDLERYVVEEHVEDFRDGLITRRELLRRVALITGSVAAAGVLLGTIDCSPSARSQTSAGASSPSPATQPQAYATPPPSPTTDGITVKPADPRIKAQAESAKAADGTSLIGYLARPAAGGRSPGVLVVHENRGLVEHIKDVVRRLATAGFTGLAVDLLSRQGGAAQLSDPAVYAAELAKRPAPEMVADLRSALDHLKGFPSVAGAHLGVTGFCFGGGMVWNLLASGASVQAAAPFYGPPPSNLAGLDSTKAAVLAIYAEMDTRITGSAPSVEEHLKSSGDTYKVTVYPGVNHAFHNDTGARYDPQQAQAAWVATIEWFRKYLA